MNRLGQHYFEIGSSSGSFGLGRRRLLLAVGVAIAGSAISLLSFGLMRARELSIAKGQFLASGERRAEVLQHEVTEQLNTVNTLVAFFAGSKLVDRKEFRTFSKPLIEEHYGVLAMGWIPRIRDSQRRSHETSVGGEGFAKYEIKERDGSKAFVRAATRGEYGPIVFIEPFEKQGWLLGLDIESTHGCQDAIRRAMSTKKPASSVLIPMNGNSANHPLLFVVASARNGLPASEKRPTDQPATDGFVFGLFRIEAIAKAALDPMSASGIDVSIVVPCPGAVGDIAVYHDPSGPRDRAATEAAKNAWYTTRINVADRHWNFDCVAMNAFWKRRSTWEPTTVLLAGLLVTGFLVGYLLLLTGRTARVEQLVAERTRELQESEQRFRRLVDNAADAFVLMTNEGKILDVSKRTCESLGYTREEMLSMTLADIDGNYGSADYPRFNDLKPEEYPVSFEGAHRRKDGTTFPVEVHVTYLISSGQRLLLGLARDLSDRRYLEKSLLEEERKFKAILDQAFQFIGLMTPEGILIEANKSALTFGDVEATDVRNMPFWETPWWSHSSELQERLREAVNQAAGGKFVRMEASHLAANGELRWIDFSLKPVMDETGKVIFLIPEGRDITARKQMEEKLHKEQQLLRNMLDLHEQDRKLVAYEIHDGLAQQLIGALYKFQSIEQLKDQDPNAAKEMFDGALQLLRDAMLETRRLISGLRPPILDEAGVVDALEYLISQQRQRGGPEIEFIHPADFGRMAAPLESAVFRIVQECLTNACRYSQSETVRVELGRADDHVRIEVRDWGIGFNPAHVEQGHYGLQGIRERARLLDGAVVIESALGQGTYVSVVLPWTLPLEAEITRRPTARGRMEPPTDAGEPTA
jgi:PAS domain S-box-containing protein